MLSTVTRHTVRDRMRSDSVCQELQVTSFLDVIDRYSRNWMRHLCLIDDGCLPHPKTNYRCWDLPRPVTGMWTSHMSTTGQDEDRSHCLRVRWSDQLWAITDTNNMGSEETFWLNPWRLMMMKKLSIFLYISYYYDSLTYYANYVFLICFTVL